MFLTHSFPQGLGSLPNYLCHYSDRFPVLKSKNALLESPPTYVTLNQVVSILLTRLLLDPLDPFVNFIDAIKTSKPLDQAAPPCNCSKTQIFPAWRERDIRAASCFMTRKLSIIDDRVGFYLGGCESCPFFLPPPLRYFLP